MDSEIRELSLDVPVQNHSDKGQSEEPLSVSPCGGILIDKPAGLTSTDVLRRLGRLYQTKKLGHAGTLDPMATGLLIVVVGRATRLQDYLVHGKKVYTGVIRLGIATDSDDVTGNVIDNSGLEISHSLWADTEILIKEQFTGEILQRPPSVSAIKVSGERGYERVRRGEEFSLPARSVFIEKSEFTFISNNRIQYRICCSKGTFIRAIARDIGHFLGGSATLESIRRNVVSPFTVDQALTIEDVEKHPNPTSVIISPEELLADYQSFELNDSQEKDLRNGKQHILSDVISTEAEVAVLLSAQHKLVAVAGRTSNAEGLPNWKLRFVF
ncbi:MAG: tRNA pseudouridine(55) synthase TruB [bacterium]|nr:tRNA pseudouridine(55) synthase TruB [bacterium]